MTKNFQNFRIASSNKSVVSEDLSAKKLKSGFTPVLDRIAKLKLSSSRKKSFDLVGDKVKESRFGITPKKLKLS